MILYTALSHEFDKGSPKDKTNLTTFLASVLLSMSLLSFESIKQLKAL